MADEWTTHGAESLLRTPWFQVELADVELPDGRRIDHYLIRLPPVVLTAMLDERDRVLLVWRYRFIPGTWGWELPSGLADPGEDLAAAGAREAFKETGWQALYPRKLIRVEPSGGLTDSVHHVFWTSSAERQGEPGYETVRMDWLPLNDIPGLIEAGEIRAASTAAAVLILHARRAG
jgi:8-oxo-dGTP pyrophosphatase MutT (NUDIX family)